MGITDHAYMREPRLPKRPNRYGPLFLLLGVALALFYHQSSHELPTYRSRPLPPPPSLQLRPVAPPASPYAAYLQAMVPVSTELRALAFSKIHTCPPGDHSCALVRLYRYVQQDIGYVSDPVAREHIQSPDTTLTVGAGDCEDLSILLASLLENVGIPTYLTFTRHHAYVLACGVDPATIRKTIEETYTGPPSARVSDETLSIAPHTVRSWSLPLSRPSRVAYRLTATEPIDWMVVPTAEDADAARHGRQYRAYGCSRDQIVQPDTDCQVGATTQLLVRNRADHSVQLTARLRYEEPSARPHLPPTLQMYPLNGQICLALDPSLKGIAFPGQTMPSVAREPERIAIDRTGRQHLLR